MKVSVIMAVYNAELYLKLAIDSILNQSMSDFELIVINDGSTDSSLSILNSYSDLRLKITSQENNGAAAARNVGLQMAKGQFIAILDADDIAQNKRLEKQVEFLENNSEYGIIGSNARIIDQNNVFISNSNQKIDWLSINKLLPVNPFIHSTVMFRKDLLDETGLYQTVPQFEDALLFLDFSRISKMHNLEECLVDYRLSPTAISRRSRKMMSYTAECLREYYFMGSLSVERVELYVEMMKSSKVDKHMAYYKLLAKKYLWGTHPDKLMARRNIYKLGLKGIISPEVWLLLLYSFLPKSLVLKLYDFINSRR